MLFKLFSFLVAARYCCSKSVAAAATAGAVDLNDASATATIEAARSRRGNVWRYEPSHAWCRGRGLRDGCGPYWWGRLPGFETCSLTTESTQSPIDIVTSDAKYSAAEDHALPEVAVQDGGCSSWTQFASIAAYEVSFEVRTARNSVLLFQNLF